MSDTYPWEQYPLHELEEKGIATLGRGNIISKKDIQSNPGGFPIYSSSAKGEGLFGTYGDYMFDDEMITWSVDGGGNLFYRPRHKFSVTNVSGYMRLDTSVLDYRFAHASLALQHSKLTFDYQTKAHPSVIRNLYHLPIPPLPEQKKIAEILSGIDRTSNLLSKQIAKEDALFTSFQDQLLESIVSTAFAPMHRHDSQLKILPIANLFEVQLGKMLNKEAKEHGHQFQYLGNKNIQQWNQDIHHLELMHFSEDEKRKFSLRSGDLLVCEGGDAGRCCVWEETDCEIYYQKAIHRLRPKSNDCTPTFMMHYLAYCKARNLLSDFISKTSISHLTREKLLEIPIAIPSREEQSSIVDKLESQRKLIAKLFSKSKILKDIKSAVSSDLLSGRKRVSDARVLEGVGI